MIFSRDAQTIIVPVLGTTPAMLVDEVRETQAAGADVIEWRIDMLFGDHPNFSFSTLGSEIIPQLLEATDLPILLTIRTANQGGEIRVSEGRYRLLLAEMLDTLCSCTCPANELVWTSNIGTGPPLTWPNVLKSSGLLWWCPITTGSPHLIPTFCGSCLMTC